MNDNDIEDYLKNQKASKEELTHLPEAIKSYLTGISFPANKQDIMRCAQRNESPNDILHKLSLMVDIQYRDFESISKAINDVPLNINPDIVEGIIQKAREFHAQEEVVLPEDNIDSADHDWAIQALADHAGDLTYQEAKTTIDDLDREQQETLVALMWLGRGDYTPEEWDAALEEASDRWNERTAEYLLATPMVADYLEEGLAAMSHNPEVE
jgi:hypothetical protein